MLSRQEILPWTRVAVLERESARELMCKMSGSETGGTEVVGSVTRGQSPLASGLRQTCGVGGSNGRIRDQRVRPAGKGAERNRPEPMGVEFSVANFIPLPWTLWHTVSKGPRRARSQ
jgi:hypothetical protein